MEDTGGEVGLPPHPTGSPGLQVRFFGHLCPYSLTSGSMQAGWAVPGTAGMLIPVVGGPSLEKGE